jgi:hypothetical protein
MAEIQSFIKLQYLEDKGISELEISHPITTAQKIITSSSLCKMPANIFLFPDAVKRLQ